MAMVFCRECGKKISDSAQACPSCGASMSGAAYNGKKSMGVYLILCWLLGLFGAHRYYAGKIGSAVTMTILSITIFGMLITGVWVFVDLIIGLCNLNNPGKIFSK